MTMSGPVVQSCRPITPKGVVPPADGWAVEVTPLPPTTSPVGEVARGRGAAPDASATVATNLDRALAGAQSAAPAPGRLTLGQMLDVYTAPVRTTPVALGTAVPVVGPAAPFGGSGAVARVADVAGAPRGHDLGLGPVARPLPGAIGSGHGLRVHPIHGDARMHHGIDIAAPAGTPIQAFAGGTVTFAGARGGYGNVVVIEHADGVSSRYAHQSAVDVVVGQLVAPGQVVGRVGATGAATGPHLHFELRRGDTSIDPEPHLP